MRVTIAAVRESVPFGEERRRAIIEAGINPRDFRAELCSAIFRVCGDGRYTFFAIVEDGAIVADDEIVILGGKELEPSAIEDTLRQPL